MVKGSAVEVPPPGAGVNTVTWAVPTFATSAAEMAAVRRVAVTNVVGRSAPFQRTIEAAMKLLPSTPSVKAPVPAGARFGVSALSPGAGLRLESTVTVGLVATRVKPLLGNRRNSYVPGAVGIATVHVRVVTPVPT